MAKKGGSNRRLWFSLHSWVGLKFSLLFFFVSLTGTIAVYAYEVDWLFTPALRVKAPAPDAERLPPGTLLAAALAEQPQWQPNFLRLDLPSYMAAELIALDKRGNRHRVYINPYTGKVQGTAGWFNAHRFLRQAHRHLMLPLKWGLTIVALLSIPLLLSMVSAFPIFKRWWRGFFKLPQKSDPPRRWWGHLHRWLGLWCLPFILIIGLTGLWYLVEQWGGAAPAASADLRPAPEAGALPRDAHSLNRALDRALASRPGYRLERMYFPGEGKPVMLQGQEDALLVRPRANTLLMDPATGALLGSSRGMDLSPHQRIAEAADLLHFGTFGGQITKLLWFFWGLMLCVLSGSGAWLYALRLAGRRQPPRWRSVWRGLQWRWVQTSLVAVCLGLGCWSLV